MAFIKRKKEQMHQNNIVYKRIGYNLFCYHRMEWGLLRLS